MRKTLLAGLLLVAALGGASTASAADWAPAASATVHPGVMTYTDGAQCTANFIYTDAAGAVYIGQAAHCSGTGGQTDTDGCQTQSLPNGTPVEVTGASKPGTLVYNSWTAMQSAGETDADTCAYNDIGLIRLDPADYGKVNPSVPTLGGPTALGETTATRRHRLLVRQLLAAPGHHAALAQDRQEPRRLGRRLDAPRLHRHARHPGRFGLGLHGRSGQRVRRPVDAPARPGRGLQRRLGPAQDARSTRAPTAGRT